MDAIHLFLTWFTEIGAWNRGISTVLYEMQLIIMFLSEDIGSNYIPLFNMDVITYPSPNLYTGLTNLCY